MFFFKTPDIHVVCSFEPLGTDCVKPARGEHFDILPLLGDVLVLWGIDVADYEMGDVGGEVELVGSSHLSGTGSHLALQGTRVSDPIESRWVDMEPTRCSGGMAVQQRTVPAKGPFSRSETTVSRSKRCKDGPTNHVDHVLSWPCVPDLTET